MIELIIRGETAGHLLAEINHLASVTSIGQAVLQQRQAARTAQPAEPSAEKAPTIEECVYPTAEEQAEANKIEPKADAPKRGRGRPPKADAPAPAAQPEVQDPSETAQQAHELDVKRTAAPAIEVPKDLDALRALIQKVCSAKSPAVTEAIIKQYGAKTSLVPVEKYPEVAAKLYEAMEA